MIVVITSDSKRLINCRAPYYPYHERDDFGVSLKKGKNEVEFETDAHYTRFIQASESMLMNGEIVIGENQNDEGVENE